MCSKNSRKIACVSISLVCALFFSISGCGKPQQTEEEYVAAIGNYKLTVSDFKEGIKTSVAQKYLDADPAKAKKEILEELITRKVLLQEAQREEFDKEEKFMKEIERYWEQALLKFFLKKKSEEVSMAIKVDKTKILKEYNMMKRRIFAEIVILDDKGKIISNEVGEWFAYGDLPKNIEDAAFSLKAGEESKPIPYGGNMAVVKVLKEESMDIAPLEELELEISRNILKKTKEAVLEKWVATLRKNASVKINNKILEEIKLQ